MCVDGVHSPRVHRRGYRTGTLLCCCALYHMAWAIVLSSASVEKTIPLARTYEYDSSIFML